VVSFVYVYDLQAVATLLGFDEATGLGEGTLFISKPAERDFEDRGMGVASILL
jgi:hypothetical protein